MMTENVANQNGPKSTQERAAELKAIRENNLEEFEAEREIRWMSLMCSAQKIALALLTYPEFSTELSGNDRPYTGLRLDLEAQSIELSNLGVMTETSVTFDQAENLKHHLSRMEDRFEAFLEASRRKARYSRALGKLRKQAIRKLSSAEQIALGVYVPKSMSSFERTFRKKQCRSVESLDPEETVILDIEIPILFLDDNTQA